MIIEHHNVITVIGVWSTQSDVCCQMGTKFQSKTIITFRAEFRVHIHFESISISIYILIYICASCIPWRNSQVSRGHEDSKIDPHFTRTGVDWPVEN